MERQPAYAALAPFYDALMYDAPAGEWVDEIERLFAGRVPAGGRVLDAACGTARLGVELARRGYAVTGTDASGEMLEVAAQNARRGGVRVMLVRQRLQELYAPRQDAVICGCDGVNYLPAAEDAAAFFAAAYRCLRPGGLLLFDISSRYKLEHLLAERQFFDDGEDVTLLWQNRWDAAHRRVHMELTLFERQEDGSYLRRDEEQVQTAHESADLLALLAQAGFREAAVTGFMTNDPPDERAQRLQFCAVRPK